ncbi:MAG: hypothetical protein HY859_01950 [Caulobacterales bacterium]|nr:hypothetical protein [Caulobacterales bacterium]
MHLDTTLRDLEGRYAATSYTGPIVMLVGAGVSVVLAITLLKDSDYSLLFLVLAAVDGVIGGVQIIGTALDRSSLSEQIEATQAELKTLASGPMLRLPLVAVRF